MKQTPTLREEIELKTKAKLIAIIIRNAMEGFHRHLTDRQMKELNPIIRNAAYTALHVIEQSPHSPAADRFVDYQLRMIPPYWEEPELLEGYRQWEKEP